MRLSVFSTIKTLLGELGVPAQGPIKSAFPTIVDVDYMPVWKEFLRTNVAKQIAYKYGGMSSKYFTCAGFVSYVQSLENKAVGPVNLSKSADMYNPGFAYRFFADYFTRKRIISDLNLRRTSHKFSISVEESDFLRALIDPVCEGHMVYHVQGKEPLDKLLYRLTPTVFKTVPYEFRREVNGRKNKFLRTEQQLDSSIGWVGLLNTDDMYLEMARAQFGTVIFRYRFTMPGMYFYGRGKPEALQKTLRKRHERSVVLP